jgi:predicted nucleic acid-binding protein
LIVLDASMAISWLLNEPGSPASELNEVLTTNRVTVPGHWPVEIGNALLMAVRRKRIDPGHLAQISAELARLDVAIEPPIEMDQLSALIEFAENQGLTLYDAAYVHLSMTSHSTLATLDEAMRKAAMRLRISILPI